MFSGRIAPKIEQEYIPGSTPVSDDTEQRAITVQQEIFTTLQPSSGSVAHGAGLSAPVLHQTVQPTHEQENPYSPENLEIPQDQVPQENQDENQETLTTASERLQFAQQQLSDTFQNQSDMMQNNRVDYLHTLASTYANIGTVYQSIGQHNDAQGFHQLNQAAKAILHNIDKDHPDTQ